MLTDAQVWKLLEEIKQMCPCPLGVDHRPECPAQQLVDAYRQLQAERDAYKKAKAENDERFQIRIGELEQARDRLREELHLMKQHQCFRGLDAEKEGRDGQVA